MQNSNSSPSKQTLESIVFPAIKFWAWRIIKSDYSQPEETCQPKESSRFSDLEELCCFKVARPQVWEQLTKIYNKNGEYPIREFVKKLCIRTYIDEWRKKHAQKRNPHEESLDVALYETLDGDLGGARIDRTAADNYEHTTFFRIEHLKDDFTPDHYDFIFDYYVEGNSLRDIAATKGIPKSNLYREERVIRRKLAATLDRYWRTSAKRYSSMPPNPWGYRATGPDTISAENREHWLDDLKLRIKRVESVLPLGQGVLQLPYFRDYKIADEWDAPPRPIEPDVYIGRINWTRLTREMKEDLDYLKVVFSEQVQSVWTEPLETLVIRG